MRRLLVRARTGSMPPKDAAPPKFYRNPFRLCRRWHVLESKFVRTEENVTPDFEFCDLAHTTAPHDSRNWNTRYAAGRMAPVADAHQALREKTKFCVFLYRSVACATRNHFAEILSHHMRVETAGRMLSCVRGAPPRRPNFLEPATNLYRAYKFVIAFENSLGLHYVSEKLAMAIKADTVPIYWGNPQIANYVNPERFINAFDFDSLESLARHVVRVHKDDGLYLRYLSASSQTSRQEMERFRIGRPFRLVSAAMNGKMRPDRKGLSDVYQHLPDKRCRSFFETWLRLMTGRALPLAQRRMFHRECLSRFAHEGCDRIVDERLSRAGWPGEGGVSRRVGQTSRSHVWPHPAFYEVVDMHGRLGVKAS